MRNAGAARRRQEREPDQPPDPVAAAVAELSRVVAASDATRRSLSRHERAIASEIGRLAQLPADCPNAERLAILADRLSARSAMVAEVLISDSAHNEEARRACENLTSALGANAMMRDAWIAEGRRREAAERDAQPRATRARPAHRKGHLRPVPGIPATAVRAAAAGIVAAGLTGGIAAVHEESSVRYAAAAPRPAAITVHAGRPDTAVLVPRPRTVLPSARPSAAVASASPAPVVKPSPTAPVSSPPAPVPAPSPVVPPALSVARFLDLGDSIRGELTLTAGAGAVTWTAGTTDGITLSQSAGVLVPGQAVTLEVTDGPGDGGWVYVSFGGTTVPVHVTSGLGAPLGL